MSAAFQIILVAAVVLVASVYLGRRMLASLRGTDAGCGSCGSAAAESERGERGPRRLPAARSRPADGRRDAPD